MFFLVLLSIILVSAPCFGQPLTESPDQIWEVGDRRWTVEEERQFGEWVDENITEEFFLRYRIPTDCADAVYAIRWIYARITHLPAAATTIDGKVIGHWSTDWKDLPTDPEWHRDQRFRAALLALLMDHLSRIIERNPLDKKLIRAVMEATPIDISENRSVTFCHLYENCPWVSPHPGDSIEARWGFEKCEMIDAQSRSAMNSIAFIERSYRKRDPGYADFSIRQQQRILWRLNEERAKSGCEDPPPASKKKRENREDEDTR